MLHCTDHLLLLVVSQIGPLSFFFHVQFFLKDSSFITVLLMFLLLLLVMLDIISNVL